MSEVSVSAPPVPPPAPSQVRWPDCACALAAYRLFGAQCRAVSSGVCVCVETPYITSDYCTATQQWQSQWIFLWFWTQQLYILQILYTPHWRKPQVTANWHGTRHRNLLFSTGFRRVIHQTRDMQLVMGTEREVIRNNKNPWKCCWMRKWWSYSGESDKIALYAILWNSEWERRDSSRAEYKSLNAEGTRDLFELSSFQVAACCIFINPFLPLFSSYLTEMLPSKVDILSIGPCITNCFYYHESGMILQLSSVPRPRHMNHSGRRVKFAVLAPNFTHTQHATTKVENRSLKAVSEQWYF